MRIWNKYFYLDATKNFILTKSKIKNQKSKIKIGFIVQELAVLNKSKIIIDELCTDDRFEIVLLCIPTNIEKGILVGEKEVNDTYESCLYLGYKNLVNTMGVNGEWINFKSLNLDYVFYNRPYDCFYPEEYKSKNVSRYSKVCVVLYAMTLLKSEITTTLNKSFFRYVYLYFSESNEFMNLNKSRFLITHLLGVQKTRYFGIPALEFFSKYKASEIKSKSWEFSCNNFKVIWTPRWTTDKKFGGSNFFEYKDIVLSFFDRNKDIDLLIRPHPLLFKNFLKTGEMGIEDYHQFINKVKSTNNIDIDRQKEYIDTFWESDVLVSDISTVIPEYLITGKPVIFCKNNMIQELTDEGKKFFEYCYCVESGKELIERLKLLKKGVDEIKEQREAFIKKYIREFNETSTKNIINEIIQDYKN